MKRKPIRENEPNPTDDEEWLEQRGLDRESRESEEQ